MDEELQDTPSAAAVDAERCSSIAALGLPPDVERYFIVRGLPLESAINAAECLGGGEVWVTPDGLCEFHPKGA